MPKKTKENEKLVEKEDIKLSKAQTKNEKVNTRKTTTRKKATSKSSITASTLKQKKDSTKKTTRTKTTSPKKNTKKVENPIVEYYDLPQKYNQTVVKILAQTPKTLFIYWEISDDDIKKYKEQYGENFFETTKPVLIIYNDTLNYNFEVEINDFANSWYLHVNDSKSDYRIELGRRPIHNNENIKENYIPISTSNKIESPNDHILFNNSQKMVYFKNVKTNQEIQKNIPNVFFMKNSGKIYDIYDLYQELYKNENNLETLSNPSSSAPFQYN